MATLFYNPFPRYFTYSGTLGNLVGGTLEFFEAGGAVPKNVFSDSTGVTSIGNVIALDAVGATQIWYGEGAYKVLLKNAAGTTIDEADNVNDPVTTGEVVNVAALRALLPGAVAYVYMGGYLANGDGGGGNIFWDPLSTTADNGGTVFTPDTSSGAGRWIRNFSGSVNVRWFGATGDGATDDRAAIQDTIDFVSTRTNSGGTVYIPVGIYDIKTTGLVVQNAGVVIAGESQGGQFNLTNPDGSTILYTGSGAAIQFTTDATEGWAWGCSMRDMRFDGNDQGAYGIQLGNASGSQISWWGTIENVYVTQFNTAGVRLHGAQSGGHLTKVNCEFNKGAGFIIETDVAGNLKNTATIFTACRAFTNDKEGLLITGAVGMWFYGCDFENSGFEGIRIEAAANTSIDNIAFFGGWVEANQDDAARTNGFYSIKVVDGGVTFINFDMEIPRNAWNGATGNKHLHIGAAAQVIMTQSRLNTGNITNPTVDVDGSFTFDSANVLYSANFFNVASTARLYRPLKFAEGLAAPTAGTWKAGDIVWRNGTTNFDQGDAIGWFCYGAGTPGTWEEINTVRAVYRNVTPEPTDTLYNTSQYVDTILIDADSGETTVRLLDLGVVPGKEYTVTKTESSSNAVVVAPKIGEFLNGSIVEYRLLVLGDSITVRDVGGDWLIVESDLSPALSGLTAATTQTQAAGTVMTQGINEFSTVANTNDAATLPKALPGRSCTVVNNGANTMQVFPSSGDDAGAGVNTAVTIAAAGRVRYEAYDSTNWVIP